MKNLYQILEISQSANQEEIKVAYKNLAMKYHPDKNEDENADDVFIKINNAYETLSDDETRAKYNLFLEYESFQNNISSSNTDNTNYSRYQQSLKRKTRDEKRAAQRAKDNKQGIIVTVGILVFFISIALGGAWWNDYSERMHIEEVRERKAKLLGKTYVYYEKGEYRKALKSVNRLIEYNPNSKTVASFKIEILDKVRSRYIEAIEKKSYDKAFQYLSILKDFEKHQGVKPYYDIANFYEQKGDYEKEVATLEEILSIDDNQIVAHNKLGAIQYFKLKKPNEAAPHYKKAERLAIRYYVQKYGLAYPLLVAPKNTPPIHFKIFYEKALLMLELKDYKKALANAKWASFLNEESGDIHYVIGLIFYKKENKKQAYSQWKTGVKKGSAKAKKALLKYKR